MRNCDDCAYQEIGDWNQRGPMRTPKLDPVFPDPMRSSAGYSAERPRRSMRWSLPLTESCEPENSCWKRARPSCGEPTDWPIPVLEKLCAMSAWQDSQPGCAAKLSPAANRRRSRLEIKPRAQLDGAVAGYTGDLTKQRIRHVRLDTAPLWTVERIQEVTP